MVNFLPLVKGAGGILPSAYVVAPLMKETITTPILSFGRLRIDYFGPQNDRELFCHSEEPKATKNLCFIFHASAMRQSQYQKKHLCKAFLTKEGPGGIFFLETPCFPPFRALT